MKLPIPHTHLSLPRYAEMMGINPLHFQGAVAAGLFENFGGCSSLWWRHTWQSPSNVSHEDLARQIREAEITIANHLGFPVAPEWIRFELDYPERAPGQAFMRDSKGAYRGVPLNTGELIASGVRKATLIGNYPVDYEDLDTDGFKETASITLDEAPDWPVSRVFFADTVGDPRWEVRIRKFDEQNLKIYLDSWLLIKPELRSAFPKDSVGMINLTDLGSVVETVDVYEIKNDQSVPSVTFMWDDGHTQDGYLQIVDARAGTVRPVPANYVTEGETTTVSPYLGNCYSSEPDRMEVSIYAGKRSQAHLNGYAGYVTDPLDDLIAEAIRFLATARLDRDLCGCNNIIAIGKDLRSDMALVSPQGNFLAIAEKLQECPFGTRRGEWLAWNKLRHYADKRLSVALV